jgi:hypothetical protein
MIEARGLRFWVDMASREHCVFHANESIDRLALTCLLQVRMDWVQWLMGRRGAKVTAALRDTYIGCLKQTLTDT